MFSFLLFFYFIYSCARKYLYDLYSSINEIDLLFIIFSEQYNRAYSIFKLANLQTSCTHLFANLSISIAIFRWPNVTVCISTNKRRDLSSRMLNLTPCWPILTIYPHYLVTKCLEVRRPEGLRRSWWNRVASILNFTTPTLRTAI